MFVATLHTDCNHIIHFCSLGSLWELRWLPLYHFIVIFVNVIFIVTRVLFFISFSVAFRNYGTPINFKVEGLA